VPSEYQIQARQATRRLGARIGCVSSEHREESSRSEGNGGEKEGHRACASYWWAAGPHPRRVARGGGLLFTPDSSGYDGKIESIGRQ
jgi:hypothetical protein